MEILQEAFLRDALLAAVLSGALCAFLGVYVHLKRVVFIGIALSEVAALGVVAGIVWGLWPEASASLLTVLVALLFGMPGRGGLLDRESLLGLVYCLAAAGAILLLAACPMAEAHGIDLISGNLLYTTVGDLALLGLLAASILSLHVARFSRFVFISLDPVTARTQGLHERAYEVLLYLSLGLCIAVSMKTAGVLFVFASTVIPPMVGLVLCRRVWAVFAVAVAAALASSILGLWISYHWDLPTGPTIVGVQGALLLLAYSASIPLRR